MEKYLEGLNKEQKEAVLSDAKNTLVLAGAGSGKTAVLARRVAHIIKGGVSPSAIMAVTFTNKAANEIKERVSSMLNGINLSGIMMGTFHSIGNKIIKENYEYIGFKTPYYSIIDENDVKTILNNFYDHNKELDETDENYFFLEDSVTKKEFTRLASKEISKLKDENILPKEVGYISPQINFDFQKVYEIYERYKHSNQILDYGDLLLLSYRLLSENKNLFNKYHSKLEHILVDEFQDTNGIQEKLISLLSKDKIFFVVGDDDQSIYGWRGAIVENFINLGNNPNFNVIKLERNYRSNFNILNLANKLISSNVNRLGKNMWTEKNGESVKFIELDSYKDEIRYVINKIKELKLKGDKYSDFAIIYRASVLANPYETELFSASIPYRIYGGQSFFSKKEIKTVNAYLGFVLNKGSYSNFMASFSVPKRKGVGKKALDNIFSYSVDNNIDIVKAIEEMLEKKLIKSATQKNAFNSFLEDIRKIESSDNLYEAVKYIIEDIAIINFFEKEEESKIIEREENLFSLLEEVKKFDEEDLLIENISSYLDNVALVTSSSKVGEEGADMVNLMTIHASKGLEFKNVFFIGFEGGVIPNMIAVEEGREEEERRLAYVAVTRAIDRLFITETKFRPFTNTSGSSRFKLDLPKDIKIIKNNFY